MRAASYQMVHGDGGFMNRPLDKAIKNVTIETDKNFKEQ
jgi:hypothetical protein